MRGKDKGTVACFSSQAINSYSFGMFTSYREPEVCMPGSGFLIADVHRSWGAFVTFRHWTILALIVEMRELGGS